MKETLNPVRISTIVLLLTAVTSVWFPVPTEGQELPLKVELPPPAPGPCGAEALLSALERTPSAEEEREAQALLSEANQAAILGEDERARTLLREAAELDPTSSEIAYRLGRLLEAVGSEDSALLEYCRYLLLDPEGSDVDDVETRVEAIAGPDEDELPAIARVAFQQGLTAFDEERFEAAVLHFSRALVELPGWADAYYNRGVAQIGDGRVGAGVADLERYLELSPDAADRARVEARMLELAPTPVAQYSPGTALVTGLIFPGMGHFYSGRPGMGMLVLAGAGAGIGAALLYSEVEVRCRVPPIDGECPAGQVDERVESRPLLVPGLATAGVITVVGAIHAFRGARSNRSGMALRPDGGVEVVVDPLSGPNWSSALEFVPRGVRGDSGVQAGFRVRF